MDIIVLYGKGFRLRLNSRFLATVIFLVTYF